MKPTPQNDYPIAPVLFNRVVINEGFWLPRLTTLMRTTIPFALEKTQPAAENLRRCGAFLRGEKDQLPFPHRFVTSDLYKVMEAASYVLMLEENAELEAEMDRLIELIARAQKEDGYLYVSHICGTINLEEMGATPYSWVVHSHEVYNVGHLYEAAVAYYHATGKTNWLAVAEKSAHHLHRIFFEGDPAYNDGKPVNQAPGHQETELALCKLYRATGVREYLDLAQHFLDIRGVTYRPEGEGVMHPEYAQQHAPVREQREAVGHAVRAGYMYAGMADVSALSGDETYQPALEAVWKNMVDARMHITGGLGAIRGIEGFGPDYDLPNFDAYCETCAAIANVFFNHRMCLLHKDATYFDVAEVALFNNVLAGVNLDGDRFFYVNPLETDGRDLFNHGSAGRSPWFDCACCPSNLSRLLPQVGGTMVAHTYEAVYLLLYGSCMTELAVGGTNVGLKQESDYPFDGKVRLELSLDQPTRFTLHLRIPTWTGAQFVPGELYTYEQAPHEPWILSVNGHHLHPEVVKGFAELEREWTNGDVIELVLPMPIRFTSCDERVMDNRDRLAVTRGPLVYCAEEIDNGTVQAFHIDSRPTAEACGVTTMDEGPLKGMITCRIPALKAQTPCDLQLVPYFAWNNRGNGSMIVWLPRSRELAEAALAREGFNPAKYGTISVSSGSGAEALSDGRRPQDSGETGIPHWESSDDQPQTVSLHFDEPQKFESLGVYWFASGDVAVPASWSMAYLTGGTWQPMKKYLTDFFGTDPDRYTVVHPAAELICEGLRLDIVPQAGQRVGLLDLDLQVKIVG
jgi:uncharacterized protein